MTKRSFLSMVLATALIFSVVCTAGAGVQAKPLFDYREILLQNGLRVITLEDFSCPIVAVQIWYHVGSKNEKPERQGFAHMFEHMMFRGTDRLGPTDHFEFIRRVGGGCNGYTAFDQTVYVQQVPVNQLDLVLWLEAERMSFLKIDQESFNIERKVVEEERRLGKNQPYGTIFEEILAELFKVHPYRWSPIGNIAHLRAASVKELRNWWTHYYVPNNATLVIVGALKHQEAQEKADRYFGWIPRYPDPPLVTVREPLPKEARSVNIKQKKAPVPLAGIIYRTVPVGHKDALVIEFLSRILGKGNSSRLYRELVAEKQEAVEVFTMEHGIEQDGVLAAVAVLPPTGGDLSNVLTGIETNVQRLRTEKVTDRELTKARNQMLKSVVTGNLRIANKARLLGSAAVLEGDVSRVNDLLGRLREISPDDLLGAAGTYLAPQRGMKFVVERNLIGGITDKISKFFGKKDVEEDAPITAELEKVAPAPGRNGVERPEDYPAKPPMAKILATKVKPEFSTDRLDNGLKVLVVPNHEVPFVSIKLGLRVGAWTEQKPGTASMAMGILTKGTARYIEGELADELETYAISLRGSAGMDSSTVNANCLTEQLERAVKLMAQVVLTATFPEKEFERLRIQTRTGLVIDATSPSTIAGKELSRRLYGKHPYARTTTGEVTDLDNLTVEDLKTWWSNFARPDLAVLVFSGDVDRDRAVKLAQEAFGKWKAQGQKPQIKLSEPPKAAANHVYLVDQPDSIQSQIRIGQLSIGRKDPRHFTTKMINGYFGHGFGARLNEAIRVKKGLTYGIWGGYSAGKFAGRFRISTFTKTESTAKAVAAILDEVKRLRREAPSNDELDKTRWSILGGFAGKRETPQAVAQDLWYLEDNNLPADYFDKMLLHVERTTAKNCLALATDSVDPEKLVIVVVGDADKIKTDLEKIAPVTVIKE